MKVVGGNVASFGGGRGPAGVDLSGAKEEVGTSGKKTVVDDVDEEGLHKGWFEERVRLVGRGLRQWDDRS